jgi:hypothetical protein
LDIGENSSVSPLNQPWLAEECRLLIVDDVKGTVSLSPRPEHVRCSVWVTDDKNNADQLQQTLQTQWLGNNEQIHLVDVQALAYKPVK